MVRNASLEQLISMAYGIEQFNVRGGQSWLKDEAYDITARVEDNKKLTLEQMQPLLQNLLEQRFHLAVHKVNKEVQGYSLVVAKGGPRLQVNKGAPTSGFILRDGLQAQNASMPMLALMVGALAGGPVEDKTGIAGTYDVKLSCAGPGALDSSLPSISAALPEQIGLKLVPQKTIVVELMVDHVDRIPTEN